MEGIDNPMEAMGDSAIRAEVRILRTFFAEKGE